jgi:hypothetical protein
MDTQPNKSTVPRCVVCAQPAEKLKCVKCKTPYCSAECQTVDWKERGHKKECKRLVKANAAAAAERDASQDEASTPPPSPKTKTAPPVVDGPARGRADVARARAAAAVVTTMTATTATEPEHWCWSSRCPVCLEDWDVNEMPAMLLCCCKIICTLCLSKIASANLPCPLCRTPIFTSCEESLKLLRRHVDNGIPAAICQLGQLYAQGGFGLVPSKKKAARLYHRAADLGDVMSMYNLACQYAKGEGVKLDKKKVVKYHRMAADRGMADSLCSLGVSFYEGDVTPPDYAEAMRLFKLAAEQGYTEAEYNLGTMYDKGNGVAQDYAEAARWYERAAAKGDEDAKSALARIQAL